MRECTEQACLRGAQHNTQEISESGFADVRDTSSVHSYQSFRDIQQLHKCKPESPAISEIALEVALPQRWPFVYFIHRPLFNA